MPIPVPLEMNIATSRRVAPQGIPVKKRSMIYRPYEAQGIHDPTKAFRDSKVIYLSDYKIYRECRADPYPYPLYGKLNLLENAYNLL